MDALERRERLADGAAGISRTAEQRRADLFASLPAVVLAGLAADDRWRTQAGLAGLGADTTDDPWRRDARRPHHPEPARPGRHLRPAPPRPATAPPAEADTDDEPDFTLTERAQRSEAPPPAAPDNTRHGWNDDPPF